MVISIWTTFCDDFGMQSMLQRRLLRQLVKLTVEQEEQAADLQQGEQEGLIISRGILQPRHHLRRLRLRLRHRHHRHSSGGEAVLIRQAKVSHRRRLRRRHHRHPAFTGTRTLSSSRSNNRSSSSNENQDHKAILPMVAQDHRVRKAAAAAAAARNLLPNHVCLHHQTFAPTH